MMPGAYDLRMYRGDSYSWRFRLWADASQSVPVDLTGATVKSEIRDKPGGATVVLLECVVTLPNTIDVTLDTPLWTNVPASGAWDLEVTHADGEVRTVVGGKVSVEADVTSSTPTLAVMVGVQPAGSVTRSPFGRRSA